jgi:hypothetical protein
VSLWKRQEIQEVPWRRNAQGEFEGKERGCSCRVPALRGARNFAVGSGSDEESFPPVAYRVAMPRSSCFRHMVARLALKGFHDL